MNRLAPQHTYTHTYILTFLSLILQALPPRHFGAYDSRDRLHSVFSVNDWARGPIRRRDGERKSEDNGVEGRGGSLRGGGGEQTQHRFKHGAERVPWPLSGPKSGLEFLRIALLTVSIPWQIPSLSFFFSPRFSRSLVPLSTQIKSSQSQFHCVILSIFYHVLNLFRNMYAYEKKNIALLCILFSHELIFIMLIILCTTIFYLFFFYYYFIFVYLYMLTLLISVFTLLINIARHKN